MNRIKLFFIFLLTIFTCSYLSARQGRIEPITEFALQQDPLKSDQQLYNGKAWHNLYGNIKGDQFLFSKDLLPGSVTINGKSYNNLSISYDIYNDEIITPTPQGTMIKLNKEMVDSFTIKFAFKTYRFRNTLQDSLTDIKGYVNVLYEGKSSLYIKYKKEIELLAVDDKYDLFFQTYHVYFVKDGIVHQLTNKSGLLKILSQDKILIKDFIKKNNIKISKKDPESFIPVIRYYDSISH
jgi:hypothetical protein